MIELQLLTGMRSSEVCAIRAADIDRSDPEMWVYRPTQHKTAHHGQHREIQLGPRAQALLRPLLQAGITTYVFRPAEACDWRNEQQRAKRRTPQTPSHIRRAQLARNRKSARAPRERYDKHSYARAIKRACDKAFPLPTGLDESTQKAWRKEHRWHPHQLRHTYATNVRREHGVEMVGTMLGDRSPNMVAVYAEQDLDKAREVALRMG